MSPATLTLEGIAVARGGRRLLEDVALRLEPGERVALTGPSGSGKTTLLRAVAGLVDPLAGAVRLGDAAPEELGWPRFRRRVVYLHQQPQLLAGRVRDNLARPFEFATAEGPYPSSEAAALMERVGLPESMLDSEASSLSVGEQQRVCLIRALLVRPDVLLLDEPTSGLDPESARAVEALVVERTGEGRMAALVVTHDASQAERWCDRKVDVAAFRPGGGAR